MNAAIDILRLVCVLLVVPRHCPYSHRVPIPPCGLVRNFECFFSTFPSLDILFFLSGFLFFVNLGPDADFCASWLAKLRRRAATLFVPYLAWTTALFVWNAIFHRFPEWMSPSDIVHVLRFYIEGGFGLWYLKTLMIAALAAPAYWLAFKALGRFSVPVGLAICILRVSPVDRLFFNPWYFLGACLAFEGVDLNKAVRGLRRFLPAAFVAFLLFQTLRAANVCIPRCVGFVPYLLAASFFSACTGVDIRKYPRLRVMCEASMFLYVSHIFVAWPVGRLVPVFIPLKSGVSASAAFIVRTVLTIVADFALFLVLRKFAPKTLSVITGGRGSASPGFSGRQG